MQCHYSSMAHDDLTRIARHIARTHPGHARAFAAEQRERCNMLARHPGMGHQHAELGGSTRLFAHGTYVILFVALDGGGVRIERVLQSTTVPHTDNG